MNLKDDQAKTSSDEQMMSIDQELKDIDQRLERSIVAVETQYSITFILSFAVR